MEVQPLEVYATDSNYAIIKPPGRNYPGCVIQGDSLSILRKTAVRIAQAASGLQGADEDLLYEVQDLANSLTDRLLHYQEVLDRHDIDLPFSPRLSKSDMVILVDDEEDHSEE